MKKVVSLPLNVSRLSLFKNFEKDFLYFRIGILLLLGFTEQFELALLALHQPNDVGLMSPNDQNCR